MYSKEEALQIKKKFWTAFGKYMQLHLSSEGNKVNWLNYKTGIKDLYFRADVDNRSAAVFIEMVQKDYETQKLLYERFQAFQDILQGYLQEEWLWTGQLYTDQGKIISTIGIRLEDVSIFRESDWEKIISFFKPRFLALDCFWVDNSEAFAGFR